MIMKFLFFILMSISLSNAASEILNVLDAVSRGMWVYDHQIPKKILNYTRQVNLRDPNSPIDAYLNLLILKKQSYDFETLIVERGRAKDANPIAQYNLGLLYYMGQANTQENRLDAFYFWKIAADRGYAQAQCCIGKLYEQDHLEEKATQYYEAAAAQGHGMALFHLAEIYPPSKVHYYQLAAQKGIYQAHKPLGKIYFDSNEYDLALSHYEQAAAFGDEESQYYTGYLLEIHKREYLSALEYYHQAADKKYKDAFYRLGLLHEHGCEGVIKDTEFAKKSYVSAYKLGHAQAGYKLGLIHESQNNFILSLKYFKTSAERGFVDAQYMCGQIYDELLEQKGYAIPFYEDAAAQGHMESQYRLGIFYLEGNKVPFSKERALEYFRPAAEKNHPGAQFQLALLYYQDKGYGGAAHYWRRAAESGLMDAQYELGCLYLKGLGVVRDKVIAAHYFDLAARQGHVRAKMRLWFLPSPPPSLEPTT